ncbi:DUF4417 domain-containing protein [Mogibacterium sp.]|uniref:DUF4417 domain-containing protein n=1 Tax=Mogibacterium sp. TaxID=2049035 RepID=UPI0025895AC6|nr:DUF4417 domain-containing protein [Mogibacterium sp.]MCI7124089.1 DUF4417 domain-containing protein [Mogibacterium sp.]
MNKKNYLRKNCKDVFKSFLVENATYNGYFEFPRIYPCEEIPNKLIPFSKSISCTNHNQWIHFYEDDYLIERIWNNPTRYLKTIKKYNGVILPDFSIYRDMPYAQQLWNIYRSRAIGSYLQTNGINVIPNIRYGDKRTYGCVCDGISKNSIIAIGTHGTLKNRADRNNFINGLDTVIQTLQPTTIVAYGCTPENIFSRPSLSEIQIVNFESDIYTSHKEVK